MHLPGFRLSTPNLWWPLAQRRPVLVRIIGEAGDFEMSSATILRRWAELGKSLQSEWTWSGGSMFLLVVASELQWTGNEHKWQHIKVATSVRVTVCSEAQHHEIP